MRKRGQVTVFIIIGILMLFLFAGGVYITKKVTKEKITAEGEPVKEEVPMEFISLQSFTENCLRSIGERGLLILGEQGGYIYPELLGEFSVSKPTDSAGINLEPTKIPYWHYNTELNEGEKVVFSSLQPKLYYKEDAELSVEAQLKRFMEEKLEGCLENYEAFRQAGFEITTGDKEIEARVGENSVGFWLKMELKAKKGEASGEMEQFYVKIPLNLKHYYEVAESIKNMERDYQVLERQALDLIGIYSGTEVDKLPPTSAVTFEIVPTVYWSEEDVEGSFKEMLMSKVGLLRFLGSNNFYRYEYASASKAYPSTKGEVMLDLRELHQKNYDNMIIPLEGGEDLEINFDYFNWPIYFDLNDRGGKVEPSHYAVHQWMLHFGTQRYYTSYDVSYPVMITLRDKKAFNGKGYNFVFGLEANIRNNGLVKSEEEIPPPRAGAPKSMVCEEGKRNTELLRTVVVDSFSKEPLEMVQIGFTVPEQDDCMMGETDEAGEFESKFPAVYGGVANFIKEEYLTNFYPIDTYKYKEKQGIIGYAVEGLPAGLPERVVEMHRYKKVNVSFKKKELGKCVEDDCFGYGLFGGEEVYSYTPEMLEEKHKWLFTGAEKRLGEGEKGVVILERVGDLNPLVFSEEFIATVGVEGGGETEGETEVELVPGIYKVNGLLTSGESIVIPEEERCSGGLFSECFTFDETTLNKVLLGQIIWDTPGTYLKIKPEELYGAEKMTFYILSFNLKAVPEEEHLRVLEDMQVMGMLGNLSQRPEIREALEPAFS